MQTPDGKFQYNFGYDDWFALNELSDRRIVYNGEVEDDCVDIISMNILRFNAEDKGIPVEERKPIILYLNSTGGSVDHGLGACSAVLCSETPVYTVNMAICMSMAFMLYICGAKRFAMPYSQFLMHDGSTFIGYESTAKVKDRVLFDEKVEQEMKQLVLNRTKITSDFYDAKYRTEFYFLPEEAKKLGVVDYIIGKDCKVSDII